MNTGAVTGRERRCGWIDLVALKYAIMIDGVTKLIMMKSDVLDSFETIKACVAYRINGKETTEFPYSIEENIEPVYVELPGWKTDMTKIHTEKEFPQKFNDYIAFWKKNYKYLSKLYRWDRIVNKRLSSPIIITNLTSIYYGKD